MKKRTWIILIILAVIGLGYFILKPNLSKKKVAYAFTQVEKGNIELDISCSGTLEAINTVEVGTQISGTINKIYVDYNDKVLAGQLLAEMDLQLLGTSLNNAKANLAVIQSQLNMAKDTYDRNKSLFEEKIISEKDYLNTKFTYDQAVSSRKAAVASVKNIEVNMSYGRITSPISGTVIERSVEEGQTVAASFATPRMFIIAEDLSKMQILADVDESDIGYVKQGMTAKFTVLSHPDITFFGTVGQIRLQPTQINNVVNYQVVVSVKNDDGKLLPGMTTNIEFIIDTAKDVMLVNNSALRFKPTEDMLSKIKPTLIKKSEALPNDSIRDNFKAGLDNELTFKPNNFKNKLPKNINGFFYVNASEELDFQFVNIGIKTGLQSEITSLSNDDNIANGLKVINGIKSENE